MVQSPAPVGRNFRLRDETENRYVGAFRQLDTHAVVLPFGFVVFLQSFSKAPSYYANNGIDPQIVGCTTVKHLGTDDSLFQLTFAASQLLFNSIAEKNRKLPRMSEFTARGNTGEFCLNCVCCWFLQRRSHCLQSSGAVPRRHDTSQDQIITCVKPEL